MINIRKQTKWYNDKADAIDDKMRLLGFYRKPKVIFFCDSARLMQQLNKLSNSMGWLVMPKDDKLEFIINSPGGNI